jgi:hypothetical protein
MSQSESNDIVMTDSSGAAATSAAAAPNQIAISQQEAVAASQPSDAARPILEPAVEVANGTNVTNTEISVRVCVPSQSNDLT